MGSQYWTCTKDGRMKSISVGFLFVLMVSIQTRYATAEEEERESPDVMNPIYELYRLQGKRFPIYEERMYGKRNDLYDYRLHGKRNMYDYRMNGKRSLYDDRINGKRSIYEDRFYGKRN